MRSWKGAERPIAEHGLLESSAPPLVAKMLQGFYLVCGGGALSSHLVVPDQCRLPTFPTALYKVSSFIGRPHLRLPMQ